MGQNRDLVLEHCNPAMELGFSLGVSNMMKRS